MSALTPKARAIVCEGRSALLPPPGERERIEALLDARLSALSPTVRVDAARPVSPAGWRWLPPFAIGVVMVGGGAFFASRAQPPRAAAPLSVPAPPPVTPSPLAVVDVPAVTAPVVPELEPTSKVVVELPPPAPPVQDRLAEEVALLSRATSALRAGRAAEALKLLDEHQRKFPKGVLGVERRGARALALCALKRVSEGRAELARLAPQSPAAGRAKQVCDAASAASDDR